MKKTKLIVDGKKRKKKLPPSIKKIVDLLDSLKYGKALTVQAIRDKLGYSKDTDMGGMFNRNNMRELKESYSFRESYHCSLWANPKTIADIKNGKIEL